jgi:hypothetical protein
MCAKEGDQLVHEGKGRRIVYVHSNVMAVVVLRELDARKADDPEVDFGHHLGLHQQEILCKKRTGRGSATDERGWTERVVSRTVHGLRKHTRPHAIDRVHKLPAIRVDFAAPNMLVSSEHPQSGQGVDAVCGAAASREDF